MNEHKTATNSGVGFVGLLQLVFIVLKLCNVIDWKWGWVLSPLWISAILTAITVTFWLIMISYAKRR